MKTRINKNAYKICFIVLLLLHNQEFQLYVFLINQKAPLKVNYEVNNFIFSL